MTVADVFVIRGRGLVATGKIEEGTLRVGDEVRLGDGRQVRVDGIEAFRKILEQAQAGDNVGLLFTKLGKSDLGRGDVITGDGAAAAGAVAPPPAVGAPGRDPRFAQIEAQRTQLLSMRETGLMTNEQIDESLRALMFAVDGRNWILTAASDEWLSSPDGEDWKHDKPPG
jgi:hypothetical protein